MKEFFIHLAMIALAAALISLTIYLTWGVDCAARIQFRPGNAPFGGCP